MLAGGAVAQMVATTYLKSAECTAPTCDGDVDRALEDVRRLTGEDWRVELYEFEVGFFLWRSTRRIFTLYARILDGSPASHGYGEFQIINFAPSEPGGYSINHEVSRTALIAYLHGVIAGTDATRRQAQRTQKQPEG